MRHIWLFATLIVFGAALGLTQTTEELVNDGRNTDNVTTESMGFDRKSYSPLRQIDKTSVKRLVPIWNQKFADLHDSLSIKACGSFLPRRTRTGFLSLCGDCGRWDSRASW